MQREDAGAEAIGTPLVHIWPGGARFRRGRCPGGKRALPDKRAATTGTPWCGGAAAGDFEHRDDTPCNVGRWRRMAPTVVRRGGGSVRCGDARPIHLLRAPVAGGCGWGLWGRPMELGGGPGLVALLTPLPNPPPQGGRVNEDMAGPDALEHRRPRAGGRTSPRESPARACALAAANPLSNAKPADSVQNLPIQSPGPRRSQPFLNTFRAPSYAEVCPT
jgi:hypothetical protein